MWNFFIFFELQSSPSGTPAWDAGSWIHTRYYYKRWEGNGEWKFVEGWRPEDFESPIVFVWLTKTKKESPYAVHESSSAVKYHLLRLHQLLIRVCTQLTKHYVANGEWRLANGERSWTCGQGSTIPATPSGAPSSRGEIQGQWTIMEVYRQWRMEHGQWSLRIIWLPSEEGPRQVRIQDSQENNAD